MRNQKGFTVLELIIVIVFLAIAGTVFFVQKRDLEMSSRDTQRKTAINALYYNLEYVYYPAHNGYPQYLTADGLPGIDPTILKDPEGVAVNGTNSDYRYEPKNCTNGICQSYTLRTTLEQQSDYTKTSIH